MIAMTITRIGIRVGISDMRPHLKEGEKHSYMMIHVNLGLKR